MYRFDSVGHDLRRALRGLARQPGFSLAGALTLAIGIGATTAIFSVVYSVLVKPLPFPESDALVSIQYLPTGIPNASLGGSDPSMFFTYREENRTFDGIGMWQAGDVTLTGLGEPERVRSLQVTQDTLQALGVQPMRGRGFTEQEHGPGSAGPLPVILSHSFWQRRFGGDDSILGRDLSIEAPGGAGTLPLSGPSRVVGIMPPDFSFLALPQEPDLILAIRLDPAAQTIRANFSFQTFARLKPATTPTDAHADLERMWDVWLDAWPLFPGLTRDAIDDVGMTPVVRPWKESLVGGVASTLWILMSAIGAVLLIACANTANLTLVRSDARRQEFAVRAALGAVPYRVAREILVESLLLGAAGGVLGLGFAYISLQALLTIAPANLPRLQEVALNLPVLAFTVVIALMSTMTIGVSTALKHVRHFELTKDLSARGSSTSRERSATRNILVIAQVALAFVLVVSAALMIRTFQALQDVDPGFEDPATIQTVRIFIPTSMYPEPARFTGMEKEIQERIAALPGVAAVGFANLLPMESPFFDNGPMQVEGQIVAPGDFAPARGRKFVSPGYFNAMGTRIIAGRDISWSDIESGGRVVLISENFARELAAEPAGALGKRIRTPLETDAWRTVIGVVQDVSETSLGEQAPTFAYLPVLAEDLYGAPLLGRSAVAFSIRTQRAGTGSLVEEIRQAIWSVSASIPLGQPRTMQDLYARSLGRTSFTLVTLSIAGGMALLLGIVGIYGVIAYVVSQTTREIGIRSALGAEPRRIRRMFLLYGLSLCGTGIVVGLSVAAALGRSMSSLLFGIEALDPAAYLAAIGVVLTAAALASYLPARRAAMVDPMATLRAE